MNDFNEEREKIRRKSRLFGFVLFAAVLVFFFVLGLILPLRPAVSEQENRKLAEFPEFSLSAVMDGTYFSDISKWYSDTFPGRDLWVQADSKVKSLYGIRTVQVIQGDTTKDEIPDTPRSDSGQTAEAEETAEETGNEPAEAQTAEETSAETEPGAETESAEEDNGPSGTVSETTAGEEQTSAVSGDGDDLPMIQGQVQDNLIVDGDTAYGIYYFNLDAANIYIDTVNRAASELSGQTDVYCMLVPISSTVYVSRDTLDAAGASDEEQAISYYYGSMSDSVNTVSILDTLREHRDEYIYFRTDHHWNGRGAYYAACRLLEEMGQTPHDLSEYQEMDFDGFLGSYYQSSLNEGLASNPDVVNAFVPITYNLMTYTRTDGTKIDWPIINDVTSYRAGQKYSAFAAGDNPFSEIHNPNVQNGRSAVVIKESYGNAVIPFLTDYYEDLYWIDYRYYNGNVIQFVRENGIDDLIFINAGEPISSVNQVNRLSALIP